MASEGPAYSPMSTATRPKGFLTARDDDSPYRACRCPACRPPGSSGREYNCRQNLDQWLTWRGSPGWLLYKGRSKDEAKTVPRGVQGAVRRGGESVKPRDSSSKKWEFSHFSGLDCPVCWLYGLVCSEGKEGLPSGRRGLSPLKGGHVGSPV